MRFVLEPLPYDKSALEPHISARTLEFHYEKHHRGYLNKLETAIGGKPQAEKSLVQIIRSSDGKIFNIAAQVWNHTFYWDSMSPSGGGKPSGALAEAIERDFGGVLDFRRKFAEIATGEFGSGWAWLVRTPQGKLRVLSTTDAETPITTADVPILTCDVWEHAYYLDYQNERAKYVEAFLDHLVNWDFAAENLKRAGG